MIPKTRRKTLAIFIGTVAVVLTIAFAPFNTILVPSFTIHDSVGYSTISGNLSNESKMVEYYGKDTHTTSIITEYGMPNSTFSLNLTTVFANYEPFDIFLGFDISIYGSIASNLIPSSMSLIFRTIISNHTGNLSQSWVAVVFPLFQRATNVSTGKPQLQNALTEYYYPIKLVNLPHWDILSGYNVSTYHFSLFSQVATNLVLYNGTHIMNVTAELNVGGQILQSSAQISVIDQGSGPN